MLPGFCVPVMVYYPIFKKLYELQSQSNSVPTYASDFSEIPTQNKLWGKKGQTDNVGVLHPLLMPSASCAPSSHSAFPPPSAPTWSNMGLTAVGLLPGCMRWFACCHLQKAAPLSMRSSGMLPGWPSPLGRHLFRYMEIEDFKKWPRGWLCELVVSSVLDAAQFIICLYCQCKLTPPAEQSHRVECLSTHGTNFVLYSWVD